MNHTKHLQYMVACAAVILGVLVLFDVPFTTALRYAVLLACPATMIGMMILMNRGTGRVTGHHDSSRAARSDRP